MNMIKGIILFCALAMTGVSKADNYSYVVNDGQCLTMKNIRVLEN